MAGTGPEVGAVGHSGALAGVGRVSGLDDGPENGTRLINRHILFCGLFAVCHCS